MKHSCKLAGTVPGLAMGCLLLLAAPVVRAQDDYSTRMMENSTELYNNNIATITNGIINKSVLDKAVRRNNGTGGSRSLAATTAKATARNFAYVPTAALRQRTADAYVAKMRATNPAAAATVAAGLAGKTNYTALYHEINDGSGLPENDAAAAMATYMLVNWVVVNNVRDEKTITPAKARAVQAQAANVLAGNQKLDTPGAVAQLGEQLKLNAAMLEVGWLRAVHDGTDATYRQKIAAQLKSQFRIDMTKLQLTEQGLQAKGSSGANGARPTGATAPSAGAHKVASGTGVAAGAQWFFRAVSGVGAAVGFEPTALLADGQYVDVGSEPLETLNAAADKAHRPAAWGHWRKDGSAVVLTNYKSQSHSYSLGTGSWFPAYPAGAAPLKRAYECASGGQVGVASALFISKIQFLNATQFSQAENKGVSSNTPYGNASGKSTSGGTYRLQGHTLILAYANGLTVRKSFALGASGSPARPASTLIFIGGDTYTDE
ncbi:MAG: hypothetical protein EOO62_03525 [Hymenobacter sp.]|nr:MAG: hypothetical protein EOO62_03525 [Hymenobacter sp.]